MEIPLSRPPVRARAQEIVHGTVYAYQVHRCSCDICRAGHAKRSLEQTIRRSTRIDELPAEHHGRLSTYTNWRCRCDLCRAAGSAARTEYNRRKRAARDAVSVSHDSSVTRSKTLDQPQTVSPSDLDNLRISRARI